MALKQVFSPIAIGPIVAVALLMAAAATLYSSVGHGGASAYLAIMALFALPAEVMRPTALVLNLLVSGVAAVRFLRAGQFNLRLFLLGHRRAHPSVRAHV